jgi:hypothetical protein
LPSDLIIVYSLVAVNVLLYGFMLFGYIRGRTVYAPPKITRASDAFAFLEKSFKISFPEIRDGFTWSEAIVKAKNASPSFAINWRAVNVAVGKYEAYRYGEKVEPDEADVQQIMQLALWLRTRRPVAS